MAYCPVLIADYFIAHSSTQLTPLQVIKLVYIAHGYSLAILRRPLIEEAVEAWRYGPVVPSVYHSAKRYGGSRITKLLYSGISINDSGKINDAKKSIENMIQPPERAILDAVLEGYGRFTGIQLTNITHDYDTPWRRYFKSRSNQKIPDGDIKRYYSNMIHNVST